MSFKIRVYCTAFVTLVICSLLAWNYYHGGVPSHHVLAREDLPLISNWWGAVLLPLLTWFLSGRVQKRIQQKGTDFSATTIPVKIIYAFLTALLFGATLATFFTVGPEEYCGYMLMSVLALAFFLPVYRAECLLGFVLGMTYTFGAVLPTLIGTVLLLISVVLYKLLRPAFLYAVVWMKQQFSKPVANP